MTAHLDREQLLRWRDHGAAEDRAAVIGHLAACGSCAATYAELVRTGPAVSQPVRFDPADFVSRGYAVREQVARREAAAGSRVPGWMRTLWNPSAPLARTVIASQLALILVLAVYVALPRPDGQTFGTLSGSSPTASGARINVIFQAGTTEEAMRRVLVDIGGRIVSGPSALGVYVVELPSQKDGELQAQKTIDALRANSQVVQFVEREP